MSLTAEILQLSHQLKRERLFVTTERQQLLKLNDELKNTAEMLFHNLWKAKHQRDYLELLNRIDENTKPADCCARVNQLDRLNFVDSYHCLSYHDTRVAEMLKNLRENPHLIAHCVAACDDIGAGLGTDATRELISVSIACIYGNCVMREDELSVLHLLHTLMHLKLLNHSDPRKLIRKTSLSFNVAFKMLFDVLFSARLFLTAAIHDPVMRLLMEDEWFYDIDPDKAVVRFPKAERLRRFGDAGTDEYKTKLANYRKFIVDKLVILTNHFIQSIKNNMHCFPSSLAWLVSQIYHGLCKRDVLTVSEIRILCTDLVFSLFICPAICDPEPHGITSDIPISHIARHNLMQIAQIVQILALYKSDIEVDSKLRDLYMRFDKSDMSGVLDAILEGPALQLPTQVNNAACDFSRSAMQLTYTQLTRLISTLRSIMAHFPEDSLEEKQLSDILSSIPLSLAPSHSSRHVTVAMTPPGTPQQHRHTTSTTPTLSRKSKSQKKKILSPAMGDEGQLEGDEPTESGDGTSGLGELEDVLVIVLVPEAECPGMLSEHKVLRTEEENRLNGQQPVVEIQEKRTRFSLSQDQESIGNNSDNQEAVSEAASSHSVGSVDLENDNDNFSDMLSANVSGRGTPSISGRDTPLSQTESDRIVQATTPKSDNDDVGDLFGKFEIKPELESEAKSTVSDTWSTDVMASDSEPPEQNHLERLEEVTEEFVRQNLLKGPDICETASDAWSTDVLASDTEDKQSEFTDIEQPDLEQDDLSGVEGASTHSVEIRVIDAWDISGDQSHDFSDVGSGLELPAHHSASCDSFMSDQNVSEVTPPFPDACSERTPSVLSDQSYDDPQRGYKRVDSGNDGSQKVEGSRYKLDVSSSGYRDARVDSKYQGREMDSRYREGRMDKYRMKKKHRQTSEEADRKDDQEDKVNNVRVEMLGGKSKERLSDAEGRELDRDFKGLSGSLDSNVALDSEFKKLRDGNHGGNGVAEETVVGVSVGDGDVGESKSSLSSYSLTLASGSVPQSSNCAPESQENRSSFTKYVSSEAPGQSTGHDKSGGGARPKVKLSIIRQGGVKDPLAMKLDQGSELLGESSTDDVEGSMFTTPGFVRVGSHPLDNRVGSPSTDAKTKTMSVLIKDRLITSSSRYGGGDVRKSGSRVTSGDSPVLTAQYSPVVTSPAHRGSKDSAISIDQTSSFEIDSPPIMAAVPRRIVLGDLTQADSGMEASLDELEASSLGDSLKLSEQQNSQLDSKRLSATMKMFDPATPEVISGLLDGDTVDVVAPSRGMALSSLYAESGRSRNDSSGSSQSATSANLPDSSPNQSETSSLKEDKVEDEGRVEKKKGIFNKMKERFHKGMMKKGAKVEKYDDVFSQKTGKKEPNIVVTETSDDILDKYRKKVVLASGDGISENNDSTGDLGKVRIPSKSSDTDSIPFYDANNLENCFAFLDAKRKLRLVLSTGDFSLGVGIADFMSPRSALTPISTEGKDKRIENDLVKLLRMQLAEALNLQNKDLIAQLHEGIRCVRLFDNVACKKLVKCLRNEYKSRAAYISYLVRCRQGLLLSISHLERLHKRVLRDKEIVSKHFTNVCVRLFLESKDKPVLKFMSDFQKLTVSDEKTDLVERFLQYLYQQAMADPMWNAASEAHQSDARLAIERVIMSRVYTHAMFPNGDGDVYRDQILQQHIKKISAHITPQHKDLCIPRTYHHECPWPAAQREIYMINAYKTPKDKLQCVLRSATTIMNLLSMASDKSIPAADDFVPVFIYVIIKANPPCLLSTVQYVNSFYENRLGGEEHYWWMQFISAVEFIKTMD